MSVFTVNTYTENGLRFLHLSGENVFADICPERGGIVTALYLQGKNILYLNPETLFDTKQNIRGGIPVLFPMSGQLPDKTYALGDQTYQMANHGLARQNPWMCIGKEADNSHAEAILYFRSNDETRKSFPFDFEVSFRYILNADKLTIQQTYHNCSEAPMPIYPGFHPYFNLAEKRVEINSKAETYLDYNDQKEKTFTNTIDLTDKPEAVVFEDHGDNIVTKFDDQSNLVIEKSPEFKYVMLWSDPGDSYVCVEPWTAKKNAYNEKKDLIFVEKAQPLKISVAFSLSPR